MQLNLVLMPEGEPNQKTQYGAGLLLVLVVSVFCRMSYSWISGENIMLFYLVSVILAALYWGEGPAVLVAFLSFAMLDIRIFHRHLRLWNFDAQYLISLATFLAVGFLISYLSNRLRMQAREARRREVFASALYSFSQKLHQNLDKPNLAAAFRDQLAMAFHMDVQVYLRRDGDGVAPVDSDQTAPSEEERNLLEQAVSTGLPTYAPSARPGEWPVTYCPLSTSRSVVGVARLAPAPNNVLADPGQWTALSEQERVAWKLVEAFCGQAALALEQIDTSEQARRAEVLAQTEKLQTALLNSISHDLQTPLASIKGTLHVLTDSDLELDPITESGLLRLATEQTERLQRLVSNLLEMTRIEGGGLRLNLQPVEAEELLGSLWNQLPIHLRNAVKLKCEPNTGDLSIDYVLILNVIQNLVENAYKYGPKEGSIEVHLERMGNERWAELSVLDRGPGIPERDRDQIFERFSRLERDQNLVGSGLGLSIAKGIAEAHGGRIWVTDRPGGGSVFRLKLPLDGFNPGQGGENP